ncbi:hypothetical protein Pmar_PMAR001101 [Perkinsus marinus ATCC 50983]|uniref:Uncharacterized protein n=1 Tax=Perkinsus marinus (strain ATCC 50983 / TXsc) TaxID=423536 RepID=C5KSV4_PERM5|nr:hypothetical protein Pmar_PMAR001101 [Perkinsus marinus ATCC 50983]EER12304.1 hypothetical protein Pmar_PMAR001101 [Perkinsus marinus ATCC 50983]|eukprot:XP_002780509.1 hypothetical protein Pmar_PMAR001101 [Perkinsus marinus ATCC 50983]
MVNDNKFIQRLPRWEASVCVGAVLIALAFSEYLVPRKVISLSTDLSYYEAADSWSSVAAGAMDVLLSIMIYERFPFRVYVYDYLYDNYALYNLDLACTALRQGYLQQTVSWVFYLPLAILGVPTDLSMTYRTWNIIHNNTLLRKSLEKT